MCGIVGLFMKEKALEPQLGHLLSGMLATMCDRGPDSAGFAIYGADEAGLSKITVQSPDPARFVGLDEGLTAALGSPVRITVRDTHAVLRLETVAVAPARDILRLDYPQLRIMGLGETIEIYKEIGYPTDVTSRFALSAMAGSHGIGHTRMATESAVTTLGAHPFSTGADQCLVHNGSLSNHANLRRALIREGMIFETTNDTEVAAAYLSHRMDQGMSLGGALEQSLGDLDGFYTFVIGTRNGFAVLRDPIACKPAVLAETEGYVAFGSEYRALVDLPGIDAAKVWEPEPATVYLWER
jgi:glutamate synthase domain-containing protein 1